MKKYFSYDPDMGFILWDKLSKAKREALECLKLEREKAAADGWNEQVEGICYGKIIGLVAKSKKSDYEIKVIK